MNRILLFPAVILLACAGTFGQGFPYQDFTRRTLNDIVTGDDREIKMSASKNMLILHADPYLSVVSVKYTGKSRSMSRAKLTLLAQWARTLGYPSDYAALYDTDFQFFEGDKEYWLPVQTKVSSYFPKELKEGDFIDVYLTRAGGVCMKAQTCDWLYLVEEYVKPKPSTS